MPAPSATSSRSGRRWSSASRTPTNSSPRSTRRSPGSMAEPAATDTFRPAALEALSAFPIEPQALELMSLSENITYRVVDRRDGAAYALRLHRPWYHSLDELVSERDWIRALDGAGIAVQAPVRTRDGREYAAVTIPATGERRFAGLARWTPGRVLA